MKARPNIGWVARGRYSDCKYTERRGDDMSKNPISSQITYRLQPGSMIIELQCKLEPFIECLIG
jgi:hypothetical protein